MEKFESKNKRPVIFSFIILTYNALDYTKNCLKSILDNTINSYELIIIDNNSSDGTQSFLRDFYANNNKTPITLILNSENEGVAGGRNQGIDEASGLYYVFLDNDTEVGKNWDVRLLKNLESDPMIGVVGKHGNYVDSYCPLNFKSTVESNKVSHLDVVAGFCFAFPSEIIKEVGKQYTGLGKFWHEDLEFCGRIKKLGKHIVEDKGLDIIHYWHKSAGENVSNDDIKKKFKGFNSKAKKVGQRLSDCNILTIRRGFKNPHSAYSIIADNLTERLRKTDLVVLRKDDIPRDNTGRSKSFDLCKAFYISINGYTGTFLHVENSVPPEIWKEDMERIDFAFTASPSTYKALLDVGIPEDKLLNVSLSGIDEDTFNMDVEPLQRQELARSIDPDKFTFFNVGASQPRKGQDILVRAFCEEFSPEENVQLFIKNYNYGKVKWVSREIAKYKNRPKIVNLYADWKAEYLAGVYRAIGLNGAYISPHRAEGYGMPQLEAIACGMRVGYTDFGGPSHNLKDVSTAEPFSYELKPSTFHNWEGEPFYEKNENPLWAEPDIEDIKKWMRKTFEEKTPTKKVQEENSKYVLDNFGFNRVAINFYKELEKYRCNNVRL